MTHPFLLDENLPKWWSAAILALQPDLTVWHVGDPGAPPLQSPDPRILERCEGHRFYLVTDNRKSMPKHLADHAAQGRHVPGIFVVPPNLNVAEVANELALIAEASFEDEHCDQIQFLPLT